MNSSTRLATYKISSAASILQLHPRTLRNYEKAGLVKPMRRGAWRYYTHNDLAWIQCLFEMIHIRGITITAIVKLLRYAPCWEIGECPEQKRNNCHVYLQQTTRLAEEPPHRIDMPA